MNEVVYRGLIYNDGKMIVLRETVSPDGVVIASEELRHIKKHSTSFAWGYGGSGPADLALSIVSDVLGYDPESMAYQQFKWDKIVSLPQNGPWKITRAEVIEWDNDLNGRGKDNVREIG